MSEDYAGQQVVGIDLHRRRSVIVRMTESGQRLETVRILNDRERLADVMARAGECPEVVLEATYGWYWAADALGELGANVHLAHPLGVKAFSYRRVGEDERDAADLADLLRMGRLPEAWIAPPGTRELRELVRHRAKLWRCARTWECQVHAVLAACGVQVLMADLFGASGQQLLERVELPPAFRARIGSAQRVLECLDFEVEVFTNLVCGRLREHAGYTAIQVIPGVGPILGAVFVAEIGDVARFPGPAQFEQLGRADPEAPRVRHQGPPWADHQAGQPAGPLGGGGGCAAGGQAHPPRAGPGPDRCPPRPQHRCCGRRPGAAHLGLLRAA